MKQVKKLSAVLLTAAFLMPANLYAQTKPLQSRTVSALTHAQAIQQRDQARNKARNLATEFGLTKSAVEYAISSLNIPKFNIRNLQHREQLRIRLNVLANLRRGSFNVLQNSAVISADPSLSERARRAIASFDSGNIQQSINFLLPLHEALLKFPNGVSDYRNVTQVIAALYRSNGQYRLADELINRCEAKAAWLQSKDEWSSLMCEAQSAISRAVNSGNPGEIKLAFASFNLEVKGYKRAWIHEALPWQLQYDLFKIAAANLVYDAPSKSTEDVLNLGEKLLTTFEGEPSDASYLKLRAGLANFYAYAANLGKTPEYYQRAHELINGITMPASSPSYLRYEIAQVQCAIRTAQYSQGLGPDPLALTTCENALQIAEQSGFSEDCVIEAQLQALDAYLTIAAVSSDRQADTANYALLDRIIDSKSKSFGSWTAVQNARLELAMARENILILNRVPPIIASVSIDRMQAIDDGLEKSRTLLFDVGYNPNWQTWAMTFVMHQAQTNARTANITFQIQPSGKWPSVEERRGAALSVLKQTRESFGADLSPRIEGVLELAVSSLAVEGRSQPPGPLLERVQLHENRIERLANEASGTLVFDRLAILLLLATLKERGNNIDMARIEPHFSLMRQWLESPEANMVVVPPELIAWVGKTFELSEEQNVTRLQ